MKKIAVLFVLLLLNACAPSKVVYQWSNPEYHSFEAQKVLIVGMTPDEGLRKLFEERLAQSLEQKEVDAVRSIDFFEEVFAKTTLDTTALDQIEMQLLNAGFDAIVVSQVTGSQDKVTLTEQHSGNFKDASNFKDYYFQHQDAYKTSQWETYTVYHAEALVYCICPDKQRELRWKAHIDLTETQSPEAAIQSYITTLLKELKKQRILLKE
ncbi:MAG TPA: hypothetical protein PKW08_09110 [Flavobacteriaceae bacterium]|nr:hypothetical protein [Flavobacteriaceae bacterium]MCB9213863.1 hypothetical protein [Alteromonas sp.]HPF11259.1 hypothetical protein [Flavobacteriaceae bacterium]HQU21738.1 hypothetical protein [Flavobacteriaceae bacterium]HQU64522.1 hypothetical protein [Flavobacteriaceae bacterium]